MHKYQTGSKVHCTMRIQALWSNRVSVLYWVGDFAWPTVTVQADIDTNDNRCWNLIINTWYSDILTHWRRWKPDWEAHIELGLAYPTRFCFSYFVLHTSQQSSFCVKAFLFAMTIKRVFWSDCLRILRSKRHCLLRSLRSYTQSSRCIFFLFLEYHQYWFALFALLTSSQFVLLVEFAIRRYASLGYDFWCNDNLNKDKMKAEPTCQGFDLNSPVVVSYFECSTLFYLLKIILPFWLYL